MSCAENFKNMKMFSRMFESWWTLNKSWNSLRRPASLTIRKEEPEEEKKNQHWNISTIEGQFKEKDFSFPLKRFVSFDVVIHIEEDNDPFGHLYTHTYIYITFVLNNIIGESNSVIIGWNCFEHTTGVSCELAADRPGANIE